MGVVWLNPGLCWPRNSARVSPSFPHWWLLASLPNSSPCGLRTLEAVVLRGFPPRNEKLTMGVFKAWCGWCSIKEGQVTKPWLSEGCLWIWPWPSGCVSSQCPLSEPLISWKGKELLDFCWMMWNLLKCYPIHVTPASSEELVKIKRDKDQWDKAQDKDLCTCDELRHFRAPLPTEITESCVRCCFPSLTEALRDKTVLAGSIKPCNKGERKKWSHEDSLALWKWQ